MVPALPVIPAQKRLQQNPVDYWPPVLSSITLKKTTPIKRKVNWLPGTKVYLKKKKKLGDIASKKG